MTSPHAQGEALIVSLAPSHRSVAAEVLSALLAWTAERAALLTFDAEHRQQPHVRFNAADGRAFWIARGTLGGDAKVEILTRTEGSLPTAVREQIRRLLRGCRSEDPESDQVVQVPMASISSASARERLLSAMDLALGAVAVTIDMERSHRAPG